MSKKYAVRNIRLCTKDCICLYVCPTGATDTENSVIDVSKCIGCEDCFKACPSGAISMVPFVYPPQQEKDDDVVNALKNLMRSKSKQENISLNIDGRLGKAHERSNRIMAEDIIREAGYLLPQSDNTIKLINDLLKQNLPEDYPVDKLKQLLDKIQ